MSGPRRSTRVKATEPEEVPVTAKKTGKGKATKKKVEAEEPAVEEEEAEEAPVAAKKSVKGKRGKKDEEGEGESAEGAAEDEDSKPKAKKSKAAKAAEAAEEEESSEGLAVGSKSPDFSAKDEAGQDVSSKTLAGKFFCLFFYPKDNTPGCTKESCRFRDLHGEFAELDCAVFGVSADHAVSHGKFKAKFDLNFPLLVDTDRILIKAFKAHRPGNKIQRSSVLIDKEGNVAAVWNPVKGAETHPNQVLAKLKELAK